MSRLRPGLPEAMLIMFGCVMFVGGCTPSSRSTTAGGVMMPGDVSRSPSLTNALAVVIDDAARDHAARFGRVPELSGQADEIERLIAELTQRYPDLLYATPEEESRLQAGRVDYSNRMNQIRAHDRRVQRERIGLPIVSNYLLEQFRIGRLVGIRLELAARLLEAQLNDPYYTSRPEGE